MTERLFDDIRETNPNASIMLIEQQEGGAEDDSYFGSIGDATANHIQNLDGFGLQMWNELIVMPSGDMYRMVPSWEENDRDPNNLRGQDLGKYVASLNGKVSEAEMVLIMEAIEVEVERRGIEEDGSESEDALDQDTIPYQDWEKFPGHMSSVDIPSTPRDRAIFMGNTRQQFYDEFPEGHPDSSKINQFLSMFNRKWEDGLDHDFAEWAVGKDVDGIWTAGPLNYTPMKKYVRDILIWLVRAIAGNNNKADEFTKRALLAIDRSWAIEYLNQTAKKSLVNPMTQLFLKKEKEWETMAEEGFAVQGAVKQFGSLLFKDFRNQMTGYHWQRYRRSRDSYAPHVIIKNVDINRCSISELQKALRIDKHDARNVWFARPFTSLEAAYSTGYVNSLSFADNEKTDKIVLFIEKHSKIACDNKDVRRMNDVCKVLMGMQREKKGDLLNSQWTAIWKYYNIQKAEVLAAMNNQERV